MAWRTEGSTSAGETKTRSCTYRRSGLVLAVRRESGALRAAEYGAFVDSIRSCRVGSRPLRDFLGLAVSFRSLCPRRQTRAWLLRAANALRRSGDWVGESSR